MHRSSHRRSRHVDDEYDDGTVTVSSSRSRHTAKRGGKSSHHDDDRPASPAPAPSMFGFIGKSKKDRTKSESPDKHSALVVVKSRRNGEDSRRGSNYSAPADYGRSKNKRNEYDDDQGRRRQHRHKDRHVDEHRDEDVEDEYRQKKNNRKKGARSMSPSRWNDNENESNASTISYARNSIRKSKSTPKEKKFNNSFARNISPIPKEFNKKEFHSSFARRSPAHLNPKSDVKSSSKKKPCGFNPGQEIMKKDKKSKKSEKLENEGSQANKIQYTRASAKLSSKSSIKGRNRRRADEMQMKSPLKSYSDSEETKNTTKCDKDDYVNAEISYSEFGKAQDVMQYLGYLDSPLPMHDHSVVIKVEASSVSLTDILMRKNLWHEAVPLPNISGVDCVGRIYNIGSNVAKYGLEIGDRVVALSQYLGGNARYVSLGADQVVKIPDKVDAAEAACIMRSYLTAYQCLHRAGEKIIKPGETVLVIGGNGAVAQAVIQLALVAGASRVFATAHDKYRDMIHDLGAIALPREPEDWLPEIEGQIDIAIDGVCSDGFSSSHATLRCKFSKLVCIGTAANYRDEQTFLGVPVASMWRVTQATWLMSQTTYFDVFRFNEDNPDLFKEDLLHLFQLLRDGWIRPNVAKRIPLKGVPNAHELIEAGGMSGQTICIPWLGVRTGGTNQQLSSSEKQEDRRRSVSPASRGSKKNIKKKRPITPVAWKVSEFVQKNYDTRDDGFNIENNKANRNDDESVHHKRKNNSPIRKNEETRRAMTYETKGKNRMNNGKRNGRSERETQSFNVRNNSPKRKEKSYDDDASTIGASILENETFASSSAGSYSKYDR